MRGAATKPRSAKCHDKPVASRGPAFPPFRGSSHETAFHAGSVVPAGAWTFARCCSGHRARTLLCRSRRRRDELRRPHQRLLRGRALQSAKRADDRDGVDHLQGLTYNNATFDVTTAGGFVAIGNAPGTPNVDNLGSFTLTGTPFVYTGQHFDIRVSFTAPALTVPESVVITDLITGTVSAVDNGGIFIDLDNSVKHFIFGTGDTAGNFDFFVNDVSLTAGSTVSVTGTIITITPTVFAVPEPGTYALLLAGLATLGFVAGRRKMLS